MFIFIFNPPLNSVCISNTLKSYFKDAIKAQKSAGFDNSMMNYVYSTVKKNNLECLICCIILKENTFVLLPCSDIICMECCKNYVQSCINDNNIKKIFCPLNCGKIIFDSVVNKFISNDLIEK